MTGVLDLRIGNCEIFWLATNKQFDMVVVVVVVVVVAAAAAAVFVAVAVAIVIVASTSINSTKLSVA